MSVRHALLALLSEGPKYGLQLREEFETRTGEVWPLNVGQVYATLQRLERDGLVESDDSGAESPQKAFRITAGGEEELAGGLRTPPDLAAPPRDGLGSKVLVAPRVPGGRRASACCLLAAAAAAEGGGAAVTSLELRQVSKVYGEGPAKVQALGSVSLSVEAGALVAVMGPSGSGQSTLLTIAGVP